MAMETIYSYIEQDLKTHAHFKEHKSLGFKVWANFSLKREETFLLSKLFHNGGEEKQHF